MIKQDYSVQKMEMEMKVKIHSCSDFWTAPQLSNKQLKKMTCFKNQQINVNHNPRNPESPTGQGLFTLLIIEIVIGRTV